MLMKQLLKYVVNVLGSFHTVLQAMLLKHFQNTVRVVSAV